MTEELTKKVHKLLERGGLANLYQKQITAAFILLFAVCEFLKCSLPFLEMYPYIMHNHKSTRLNSELCSFYRKQNLTLEFDETRSISSIVTEYKIFCEENQVSYIAISIFTGMFFGSCCSYLFADHHGRRTTLVYITPLYLLLLILLFFIKGTFFLCLMMLFFAGMFSYIVMITLIVYICEVIYYKYIPLYVTVIVTGQPIMGITTDVLFKVFEDSNWRYILLIIAGIGLVFYIIVIYIIVESPLYYLNNGDVEHFKLTLTIIALKNKKNIEHDEFSFLYEAMKQNISFTKDNLLDKDNKNVLSKSKQSSRIIEEGEEENKQQLINDDNSSNIIANNNNNNNNNLLIPNDNLSTTIYSEINKDTGSMFGRYKMKDYSPLDLLRYKSQIKNFLILSLLWSVSLIISHGLTVHTKSLHEPESFFYNLNLLSNFLDLTGYYFIWAMIDFAGMGIHKTLVMLQLLSFAVLMLSLLFNDQSSSVEQVFCLYISKFCNTSMYLILTIMTAALYPAMIRTQGVGVNKGIGKIGGIIGPLLVENVLTEKLIVIYILLTFFGMLFSYELPMKIGNLTLVQLPENEYDEKKQNGEQSIEERYRQAVIEDQESKKIALGKLSSVKEVSDEDVVSVGSSAISESNKIPKIQSQLIKDIENKDNDEDDEEEDKEDKDDNNKLLSNLNIGKLSKDNDL